MTCLMIYVYKPEHRGYLYEQAIGQRFPDIEIRMANNIADATAMIRGADIVLTSGGYLNDEIIRSAPSLKWIHSLLAGLDWLAKLPSLANDASSPPPAVSTARRSRK